MIEMARAFATVVAGVPLHERGFLFTLVATELAKRGQTLTSHTFNQMSREHEARFKVAAGKGDK